MTHDASPPRPLGGRDAAVEDTAALRREAAELLLRSRWWRDERRRELLRERRWYGPAPAARAGEPDRRER
jgi:hypothetical protein